MLDKVIVIYAIIDDILKAIGHFDDCRRQMSDAEILTTALVAALFFYGNHARACQYMQEQGLVGQMLGKSRFSRRLHQLSDLMYELCHQLGMAFKQLHSTTEYLLDSFPIPSVRQHSDSSLSINTV